MIPDSHFYQHDGGYTHKKEISNERRNVSFCKSPLDHGCSEDGIGRSIISPFIVIAHPKHPPTTNASSQPREGNILSSVFANVCTHALAKRPEMILDEIMTGPNNVIRLFVIRGLIISLLGRVTPDERT